MTTNPTPIGEKAGPWTVERYGDGDSLVIHDGPDTRVCFMATPGDRPGAMARIEAKAHLIAAAPALYEALKETWRVIDAAGLQNLVRGVQLGQTSWFVKASDAKALSEAALSLALPPSGRGE